MDNPSTPLGYLAHAALYWCTIFLPISIGLFLWQIFAAALLFGRKGLNWAVPASIKSLLLFSIAAASLYPGFGFYSGDTHPGHPLPAPFPSYSLESCTCACLRSHWLLAIISWPGDPSRNTGIYPGQDRPC